MSNFPRWIALAVTCLAVALTLANAGGPELDATLRYDVVVIGGGAAGATLTGKLARAGVKVLLLEAGQNTQYDPTIALMQGWWGTYNTWSDNIGPSSDTSYVWPNFVVGDSGRYGAKTPPTSGKGIGGGTSVFMANFHTGGKLMYKGFPASWDYASVMAPIYSEIVADIQPSRDPPTKPPLTQAFLKAARLEAQQQYARGELDYLVNAENYASGPNVEDPDPAAPFLNHNDIAGVNSVAAFSNFQFFINKDANGTYIRKAPANTYLGPNCLGIDGIGVAPLCRKLRVLTGAYVTRVIFETNRRTGRPEAKGVEFYHDGAIKVAYARYEVVVSGGSYQSPAVLQRSGVGDAAYLKHLGIPVVYNNSLVGKNLRNHFSLLMAVKIVGEQGAVKQLLTGAPAVPSNMGFNGGAMLTFDKHDPNRPDNVTSYRKTQFHLYTSTGILPKAIIGGWNTGPTNQTITFAIDDLRFKGSGHVQISSSNPFDFPEVYFNTFVDYSNAALSGQAFWDAARKAVEPSISGLLNYRIGYRFYKGINKVLEDEGSGARLAVAFPTESNLAVLDAGVQRYGLDWWKYLFPDRIITANSTAEETAFVQALASIMHELRIIGAYVDSHQCGSNAIGSVVDDKLRVYGVDNLRVVDASIMPIQSGGNTAGSAVAIGIRGAQLVLQDLNA